MPMVVYTEEEMINRSNEYAAECSRQIAEDRDRLMAENTQLRAQIANAELALRIHDESRSSEYWLRHTETR